ncbi:hypothetical protein EJB05_43141, partial [Eragrostis curvula]
MLADKNIGYLRWIERDEMLTHKVVEARSKKLVHIYSQCYMTVFHLLKPPSLVPAQMNREVRVIGPKKKKRVTKLGGQLEHNWSNEEGPAIKLDKKNYLDHIQLNTKPVLKAESR